MNDERKTTIEVNMTDDEWIELLCLCEEINLTPGDLAVAFCQEVIRQQVDSMELRYVKELTAKREKDPTALRVSREEPVFQKIGLIALYNRVTGADVRIKWPNDLVLNGKKLVGILTEVSLADGGVDYVVVGIGVNLRQRPEDFSPEVAKIATSLAAEGYDVERETLETALVDALRQAFRHLCAPETYLDDYRQLCLNLGRQVHILQTDETVTALDIDPQYGLVVRHGSGAVETLRCGEVSVRGLYGYAE